MTRSRVIKRLIVACLDDERTLQHERAFVGDESARTLTRLADERERFVADLERLDEPGQRRPNLSWGELLREAGRDVWVSAAGPNAGDAIATCRRSRARIEARYDAALAKPLGDYARSVIVAQRGLVRDEADELIQLQY